MSAIVVTASKTNLSVAAGADEIINGNDDNVTVGAGATLTVNGYDDTLAASDDTLTVNDNGGPDNVVNGSHDTITVPNNSIFTVNGTDDAIADGHGYVYLNGAAGSSDTITGAVLEITIPADFYLQFTGTQNDFHFGDGCYADVAGDDDNLFGSYDRYFITGSVVGGDEIVGDDDRAVISGNLAQLLLYGDNEVVHAGAGTSLAVETGTDDRFVGAGFDALTTAATRLWIGGNGASGAYDTLTGSNMTAVIGGNSNIVISGDDDTVAVRGDSHLYFVGAGLNARLGDDASLAITGKGETSAAIRIVGGVSSVNIASAANVRLDTRGATVNVGNDVALAVLRSDNVITAYVSDAINIAAGVSNQLTIGVDDAITDSGFSTVFDVVNFVGETTINNFSADSSGIVDLMNGIGAFFGTPQAAFAALTSDGAGGLKLSMGAGGTLDFAGDTSLTAANFKIG